MILFFIFTILLFGILLISFSTSRSFIQWTGLTSSGLLLILSSSLLVSFDTDFHGFQHIFSFTVNFLNFNYIFGLDGISVNFIFLTSFLIFLCLLFVYDEPLLREYFLLLLIIEFFLIFVFSVLDLFLFYVFFEAILVPMYLLIGIWGSRERKVRAVYLFFFYTLCGSILFLASILYIYSLVGTFNLEFISQYNFCFRDQLFLWFAFFLSFASKIPMFPFHVWLPEAHVEAPTVGSVLLAGVLLKLGVYGFLRFSLTLFPEASLFFSPFVYFLSLVGIVYASFSAIRQTDMKRIIAYSSIAHMNLVVLGIFSFNIVGMEGALIQSISHGFVSGGLFFLIGILYNRYHSRFLYYFGGLVHFMPLYSSFLLILTMANISLPGTSSFVGEFLLLLGFYQTSGIGALFACFGVILVGAYSLWFYNRIIFGNLKVSFTLKFADLNFREFVVLSPLIFFSLFMGIYPSLFSSSMHSSAFDLCFV